MAKFDVYRSPDGGYWLDCQNDLLSGLSTRLVVPLASADDAVQVDRKLNPILTVAGSEHLMLTHLAAAVSTRHLGGPICSVGSQDRAISNALDFLISGV